MRIAYRHKDGKGKVWGGRQSVLATKPFVAHIFGELPRPLEPDERINPDTGAIEPIPKTQAQIKREAILAKWQSFEAQKAVVTYLKAINTARPEIPVPAALQEFFDLLD